MCLYLGSTVLFDDGPVPLGVEAVLGSTQGARRQVAWEWLGLYQPLQLTSHGVQLLLIRQQ